MNNATGSRGLTDYRQADAAAERQTIGGDLAYIESTLGGLRQHLISIHDRIHGPTPMEAAKGPELGSPALNHTVTRIRDEVQKLCELAYSLSESL